MSEEIVYIDYDEALTIYGKMIDASDGGFEGVRDEGGIRATLDFVQNDYTRIITTGTLASVCVHWNLSFIMWQHRISTKICCYASSIAF